MRAGRAACATSGQMTVELAVLLPVVVVTAFVIANLMRFVGACATFDRVAVDAALSQGVSPAGEQGSLAAADEVRACIEDALADDACSVEVRAEEVGRFGTGAVLSMSPRLTRYVCTLRFRPWPSSFVIAGAVYEAPAVLERTRSIVVDRYRSGAVV